MKKLILLCLLLAAPLQAATRYVTKTGSGTVCSQAAPCLTIAAGIASMASGDTLDIGAGTYVETIGGASPSTNQPPNGGGEGTRTIVQGASAATTIIRPSSGNASGDAVTTFQGSYITFQNLTIDGALVNNSAWDIRNSSHHIKIQNCIVKNSPASQVIAAKDQTTDLHHIEIINNVIGPGGRDGFEHHIYLRSHDNLVEGNLIQDGPGYGVRIDIPVSGVPPSNNVVRGNRITDMGQRGINVAAGDNNQIYNNLIYANLTTVDTTGPGGIFVGTGSVSNTKIYNNTIYNNVGYCVWIFNSGGNGTVVRNNICYNNTQSNEFLNGGVNTIFSNNLCETAGTGCTDADNPDFVDTVDFKLSVGSPAIDTGICLGGAGCATQVFSNDFSNVSRPQGLGWDRGAQEYFPPPASINVIVPNGGENWQVGLTKTFTWGSAGAGSTVDILLDRNNDGTFEELVANDTTNDGSFDWVVSGSNTTTCKAKVTDGTTEDVSDAVFTISGAAAGSITVNNPTTGSHVFPTGSYAVTFSTVNVTGNVIIELSTDGGATYTEVLSPSFPFSGSDFVWEVGTHSPSSSNCKIKVTSLNDTATFGVSNAFRRAGNLLYMK